jgi:pimeloyl-ACP methyl ester carboxylesterase
MTILQLGCATAREREVEVNGLGLRLLEGGQAGRPPVCFLHGGSAHAHWFDAVTPALADRFRLISLDQRGHGGSAWAQPPAYATEDFAADLERLMNALGLDRMTLVGHSMGGHNAMAFAAWHPERVAALTIVDARPAIPEERLGIMRQRGRRALRLYPSAEAAVDSFRLLPRETVADPRLLAHLARAGIARRDGGWTYRFDPAANHHRRPADLWPHLGRITAPTLLVRGELSPVLPREMAERLRAAIPGAALVEIPGAYHHLVLDQPAAFTSALSAVLGAVGD